MQSPNNPELADPAKEVLVRVQQSFIQLGVVPVIEDPSAFPDPHWHDE